MSWRHVRIPLILLAVAAIGALLVLLSTNVLTLDQLKARRDELEALIAARPMATTIVFTLAFALIAAFAPGAAVMKVAAGALFGLGAGFMVAQVATSLAAVIGFLISRYLLRNWVETRFGTQAAMINRGVARDGVLYLLAMRFNPLIPFFLINMGMGLTRMRLWVFALTSFFGLIPASLVYANAGTELARIETASDIVSVRLIGSLVLLSLMPIAGRYAALWLRRRRPIAAQDAAD